MMDGVLRLYRDIQSPFFAYLLFTDDRRQAFIEFAREHARNSSVTNQILSYKSTPTCQGRREISDPRKFDLQANDTFSGKTRNE